MCPEGVPDLREPDGPAPVRFDRYVEAALYGESGFFVRGGGPGDRGGDFATSPELGSLFGRCVAAYLRRAWDELGQPDPFVVIEGGAGRGTLCTQVLAALDSDSDCADALRYVMVERVEPLRVEAAAAVRDDSRVSVRADLPADSAVGVVLANELLDNLPFRLLEFTADGWAEVHVEARESSAASPASEARKSCATGPDVEARDPGTAGPFAEARESGATGPVVEVLAPAPADASAMAGALVPDAATGARVPLQLKAAVWLRRAMRLLDSGRVLVFDYGVRTTAELAARPSGDWLRTYRAHRRGHDLLAHPGAHDITCDVAFDQPPPPATLTTQADWLAANGIHQFTSSAQKQWRRARTRPTAKAFAAKALLDEAAALTDPAGMGAFFAAEWIVN